MSNGRAQCQPVSARGWTLGGYYPQKSIPTEGFQRINDKLSELEQTYGVVLELASIQTT